MVDLCQSTGAAQLGITVSPGRNTCARQVRVGRNGPGCEVVLRAGAGAITGRQLRAARSYQGAEEKPSGPNSASGPVLGFAGPAEVPCSM